MFRSALPLCMTCLIVTAGCKEESYTPPTATHQTTRWVNTSKVHFQESVEFSIVQRGSQSIPQLGDHVKIHIDVITNGHVFMEVKTVTGDTLLPQKSMSIGSVRGFEYQDSVYAIHLIEFHNYLSGDDYATFRIGTIAEEDLSPIDGDSRLTE